MWLFSKLMQQRADLTPDEHTMSMPLKQAFFAVCMYTYVGLSDVNTQYDSLC